MKDYVGASLAWMLVLVVNPLTLGLLVFLTNDQLVSSEARMSSAMAGLGELLSVVVSIVLFALVVAAYGAPLIVAVVRDHRHVTAIAVVTILIGWTIAGWLGCLVWSLWPDHAIDSP